MLPEQTGKPAPAPGLSERCAFGLWGRGLGGGRGSARPFQGGHVGMNYIDVIGMLAGGLTTVSLVPQVLKIWRTRSANDISLGMFALFGLGVVLWLADGLLIDALPVIVANAVTLVLTLTIILMKWRFGG